MNCAAALPGVSRFIEKLATPRSRRAHGGLVWWKAFLRYSRSIKSLSRNHASRVEED